MTKHHINKAFILSAAIRIITAAGPMNFSIRKLADEVGGSIASIYVHFSSKEEIFGSIATDGFDRLYQQMKRASSSMFEKFNLEALWTTYWDFACKESVMYQVMFGINVTAVHEGVVVKGVARIKNLFFDAADTNDEHDQQDNEKAFLSCWSFVHGLIALNLADRSINYEMSKSILADGLQIVFSN